MSEVGTALRLLRTRRGFTQSQLAVAAGTSQSAISDIERGRTDPSVDTVERIALSLGARTRVAFEDLPTDHDREALKSNALLRPEDRLRASYRSSRTLDRMRIAAQAQMEKS